MNTPFRGIRIRLVVTMLGILVLVSLLVTRLGFLQVVRGEALKKEALEQWAEDIKIQPERGTIYDRKGKRLSISINGYKIECIPPDIDNPVETAKKLSELLDINEESLYNKITSNQRYIKIMDWVEKDIGDSLEEENINGIIVVPHTKRYYPSGNLASYVLGFTDIDSRGLYGVEKSFNDYLHGVPGRLIINTDIWGRQLPYDNERLIDAKPGSSLVLTIDETIQHFAEKAATQAMEDFDPKRTTVLIMEPSTGDLLAMASMPDYDPNQPRVPDDEATKNRWANLSQEELEKEWNTLWKPHPITDTYEPGSTFKIITAAAALEENEVTPNTQFYSDGYFRDIPGVVLRCWRYYDPHGEETFAEAVQNSCNPVMIEVARKVGKEKMIKYIEAFGFGEKTGIDFLGEAKGSYPSDPEAMRDVRLATLSYGQGIAVTPIQLITAASAIANEGKLMKPRIVKSILDEEENIAEEFPTEMVRKVISKDTSDTLLGILESVITEGTGKKAFVPGYRVGGKTGTAQKIVNGEYSDEKFVASFIGVAPVNDPKIVVLVIVDEPDKEVDIHGGQVAAPIAGKLIEETLNYLDIEPQFN
ncbi:peptidoglycan D,D-transpeptidase FtsI family protein [Sporosalibacterium faouarense]|uniref:peptidoglycan D,D-transpeptidase FtsI family protein n=1 Tax=Sporosalibacterium faouarense TaxID=516123 RepID=UPI00141CE9DD|nr:penicillin-binding transpeptidase domain-containing protein [Sporosalibacterium faouarense]MTI49048.1 stage V sporulation protein D [Bacillota bacterium]